MAAQKETFGQHRSLIHTERSLLVWSILQTLCQKSAVFLTAEIDLAVDKFEASMLGVDSSYQVSTPDYGMVSASTLPLVVRTSNWARELDESPKRLCGDHWIGLSSLDREMEPLRSRLSTAAGLTERIDELCIRSRRWREASNPRAWPKPTIGYWPCTVLPKPHGTWSSL